MNPDGVVLGLSSFDLNDEAAIGQSALDAYDAAPLDPGRLLRPPAGPVHPTTSTCSAYRNELRDPEEVWDGLGRWRDGEREPRLGADGLEGLTRARGPGPLPPGPRTTRPTALTERFAQNELLNDFHLGGEQAEATDAPAGRAGGPRHRHGGGRAPGDPGLHRPATRGAPRSTRSSWTWPSAWPPRTPAAIPRPPRPGAGRPWFADTHHLNGTGSEALSQALPDLLGADFAAGDRCHRLTLRSGAKQQQGPSASAAPDLLSEAKPVKCHGGGHSEPGKTQRQLPFGQSSASGTSHWRRMWSQHRAGEARRPVGAEVGGVDPADPLGGAVGAREDVGPTTVGPGQDLVAGDVVEVRGLLGQLADGPVHRRPLELAPRVRRRRHPDPDHLGALAGEELEVGVEAAGGGRSAPRPVSPGGCSVRASSAMPSHTPIITTMTSGSYCASCWRHSARVASSRGMLGAADEAGHGPATVLERGGDGQGDVGHQRVAGQQHPQRVLGGRAVGHPGAGASVVVVGSGVEVVGGRRDRVRGRRPAAGPLTPHAGARSTRARRREGERPPSSPPADPDAQQDPQSVRRRRRHVIFLPSSRLRAL